jgi:hypothetical protein
MKGIKKHATIIFHNSATSIYYFRGSEKIIGPGKGPFFCNYIVIRQTSRASRGSRPAEPAGAAAGSGTSLQKLHP